LIVPKRAFSSMEAAQVFEAQARAFRADPFANGSRETSAAKTAVWPPPPRPKAYDEPALAPTPEPDDLPGSLQIQYVTQKADLRRAQTYFLLRRPSALLSIFVPYSLAASIWTFIRLPPATALLWAILAAAAATLLTLAWTTHKALTRRFARFSSGRSCRTIIRPDMLCDVTPEGRTIYRWPEVQAVRRRFGDIYILSKGNRGAVIPRTAFADRKAAQEFAETVERFRRESQATEAPQVRAPDAI
jgi:hypothetical protein